MRRFLGVLVASMFLASAAYAADAVKEEKKVKAAVKTGDKKTEVKAEDVKAGAMGEEKKAETAKEKTAVKAKAEKKVTK
jgi:opacity protein-like surface antigen